MFFYLHAVSRTQQDREPSVNTLHSLFSEGILSGGTQRRTPRHQNEEMKIFHILEWGIEPLSR